jgi:cyclic beta-1,2-glucan synthetase
MKFQTEHGGFDPDGGEYVFVVRPRDESGFTGPPRPWINVIANDRFGFLVSESGSLSTWSGNSRERRLTPWSNDPVSDPHGEAFYIRDEESGEFWSPCPGPSPAPGAYEVRHGFGYTGFRHESHDLEQEVLLFVPPRDPLRVARIRLRNRSDRPRRLSVFAYARLVIGVLPEASGRFVVTEIDARADAIFARNRMEGDSPGGVVFSAAIPPSDSCPVHFSCDRAAFIGRDGRVSRPAAIGNPGALDGACGAGLSPCAAQQVVVVAPPKGEIEISFLLGEGADVEEARELIARYRRPEAIAGAREAALEFWRGGLSGLQIETPDPELDLLVNGWLPYQVLACRIWARTAFYQSGGAFGFRDQIQDAAALVYLWPERTRAQILLHAAHQFVEGDVLHWWHPPLGLGIRTRFADDLLWLPYITAFYIETTGDRRVLDEQVRFLSAPPLPDGADEALVLAEDPQAPADLYEHCCRAVERSLATGEHGLPLFGTGDWNDGMNRVGREGRGESVWMGFFLHDVLEKFIPVCRIRGDSDRAASYRSAQERLRIALNEAGWDGEWYRRGYYDSGDPLGSSQSDECRIDALAQAWAVLSGVAPADRARKAIDAVERFLVSEEVGIIRLLTPAFEKTANDPGYIKGYVPGVRENGGQYTHAALWVVRAVAELSRNNRAAALLRMIHPIHHTRTREQVATYQLEPYVVAADVYGEPPHLGRGGWSWYTGSAGWMYRVAVESILGFHLVDGRTVAIAPCIPDDWPVFRISYRLPGDATRYDIEVRNPQTSAGDPIAARIDGAPGVVAEGAVRFPLERDGAIHRVEIILGPRVGSGE